MQSFFKGFVSLLLALVFGALPALAQEIEDYAVCGPLGINQNWTLDCGVTNFSSVIQEVEIFLYDRDGNLIQQTGPVFLNPYANLLQGKVNTTSPNNQHSCLVKFKSACANFSVTCGARYYGIPGNLTPQTAVPGSCR
jgi:hypothetical protein